jgi:hypothetical protein
MMADTAAPDKTMTILYALGWTQHSVGSQNIRTMAMIQLLLGNMGMAGGGINALRGHANVQGITDMCLFGSLPGYLSAPTEADVDRKTYLEKRTPKPLRPNQMNFWQNFPKWFTSLHEGLVRQCGDRRERLRLRLAAEDGWRLRRAGDVRAHAPGQDQRLRLPGLQPAGFGGQQEEGGRRAGQAQVPGHHRSAGDRHLGVLEERTASSTRSMRPRSRPRCSACRPTCSPRRPAQLHQLGPRHPVALEGGRRSGRVEGRHRDHGHAVPQAQGDVRQGRRQAARSDPEPDLALPHPRQAFAQELLMEISGKALGDVFDPKDKTKVLVKAGEQVAGFAQLRDDGSTSVRQLDLRRLLVAGGQPHGAARQLRSVRPRPDAAVGLRLAGQPAHLYNRASCDVGQALGPEAHGDQVDRHGLGRQRHPRHAARRRARRERDALHHDPGRRGAAVCAGHGRRALPRALRALRDAAGQEPLPPRQPQGHQQPGGAGVQGRHGNLRQGQGLPLRGHHLPPGRALPLLDQALEDQRRAPARAVRRDRRGTGRKRALPTGDKVKVRSNRGFIKAVAVVTKRIKTLDVDGKKVHTVGIPHPLGLQGGHQAGLHHQHADAVRRRRQFARRRNSRRSWSTSRRSKGDTTWHCNR